LLRYWQLTSGSRVRLIQLCHDESATETLFEFVVAGDSNDVDDHAAHIMRSSAGARITITTITITIILIITTIKIIAIKIIIIKIHKITTAGIIITVTIILITITIIVIPRF
jgi:hypothetical protein